MRVVATVRSRMSSTRLPGKHLKPILGRPMARRLLERLKRCRAVDAVCLATSAEPSDDVLEEIAGAEGVACYRGSLDDVLGRLIGAAESLDGDIVADITGDCPLIDAAIVDAAVARYLRGDSDYATNVLDRLSFPIGFDVQIYSLDLLREVSRLTDDPYDRGNVSPFIYRNPGRYRLLNLRAPALLDRPGYRLCVDYTEDLDVVRAIYEALYPGQPDFDAYDIVRYLDANPALAARNTARPDAFSFPQSGGAAREETISPEPRLRQSRQDGRKA
jgi:spore coat polysaccharide biosynthesis protein SpsF